MNILLIEDDIGLVELITTMLKELGFSVINVATGAEALAYLKKQTPDLMLLDYSLPDINGKELIETLNNQQTPPPPFIITTGQGDERIAVNMMKLGAMDYLTKDILFLDKLPDVVKRVFKEIESDDKLKQAEKKLTVSEEKYHSIFEGVKDGILYISKDIKVIASNKAFSEITGISNEEVIGKSGINLAKKFVSTKQLPVVLSYLKSLLLDKTPNNFVLNYQDKIFEISSQRIKNGRRVVVIRDITERKKAEKELKDSKERFDLAINATKDGIFDWNLLDNTIYYSPAWKSMLGYKDDELPNNFSIWEKLTEPEDVKRSWEMQNQVINKELDQFEMEFKMKHKDGHWVDILSRAEAYFDKTGKAIRMVGTHIDITERKKAEVDLLQSEQNLNEAQSIALLGRWELNLISNELIWSDSIFEIFEIDKKKFGASYEAFLDAIHPDDREKVNNAYNNSLKTKLPYEIEHRLQMNDGSIKRVIEKCRTEYDNNGNALRSIGIVQDITKLKKTEETLRESEEIYKALYNNAPLPYQSLNTDGNFRDINPIWLSTLGYEWEEVIGKNFADFLHPDWKPHFEQNFPAFKERGYVNDVQFKIRHKDGSYLDISFEGNIGYNKDGSFKQSYCVFKDITEQKKAEHKLKESEEQYRSIIESTSEGCWVLNPEKVTIDVNDSLCKMLGYSRSEIIGKKPFEFTDEKNAEIFKSQTGKIRDTEHRHYEITLKSKSGKDIHVIFNATTLKNNKDEVIKAFAFVTNITERKQADAKIKAERDKLTSIFESMTDGVYLINKNYEIEYVNPILIKDFGLPGNKKCHNYFHDSDEPCTFCKNDDVFAGKTVQWEWTSLRNGKTYDLVDTPIKNFDGSISKLEIFRDITHRKESENKIARFSRIFEDSLNEIYLFDADTFKFNQVNMAAQNNLGYTMDEFLNMTPLDFKPEFTAELFTQLVEPLRTGEKQKVFFETIHQRKDSSLYNVEVHLQLLQFEKENVFAAIIIDVAERKQAEEAIQKSNSLLTSIIESPVEVIIFALDSDYKYLSFNKVHKNEMKLIYDADIEIGQCILDYSPNEEDRIKAAKDYERAIKGEHFTIIQEYGEPESRFWYELVYNPIINNSGDITGLTVFVTNITERKLVEEELNEHREHLEQLVNKRTVELEEKNQELDQALKVFVGREYKINELQEKIRALEKD